LILKKLFFQEHPPGIMAVPYMMMGQTFWSTLISYTYKELNAILYIWADEKRLVNKKDYRMVG